MKFSVAQFILVEIFLRSILPVSCWFDFKFGLNFLDSAIAAISPITSRSTSRAENTSELYLDEVGSRDQKKCFGELGCIYITDEWFDLMHRPLNLLPFDRDKINTRFIFYPTNKTAIEVGRNATLLRDAGFDPQKEAKFVIHGFIDTGFSSWVVKLSQLLTMGEDNNVFAVDWGGGSLPLYTQATANTRLVGLEVAHFISFLLDEFHYDPSKVHLIGHSLGSHVAGYAGEKITELGRITGLDPAEPYFQHMPEFVRLDPSDAKHEDDFATGIWNAVKQIFNFRKGQYCCVHFGILNFDRQPCGHLDFYPNDGREQPGCTMTEIPLNLVHLHGYDEVQREIFACNHHRAIYYFMESLTSQCQYVGHACANYEAYQKAQCHSCGNDGSQCGVMGIDADKYATGGNKTMVPFYLSTGKVAPFCLHHYRINIQTAFPPQAAPWVFGKLRISVIGNLAAIKDVDLFPTDYVRVDHGTNLTFLLQNSQELGSIDYVRVEWQYSQNYLDLPTQCWMFFCNSKLFIRKIGISDIDDLGLKKSTSIKVSMCGEEGTKYTGITSGGHSLFERSC